ncbi:hypothetical protein MKZ38_008758 [Zalerion maritima]|uniref:Autophagy-related protein 1 n=1 Tax=Zalerion maritima TaxID=339359 RepID=A0AAD5WV14_9PEZI|nr:hypothetical protein MKZ38_008758 [Zalerion maritima]
MAYEGDSQPTQQATQNVIDPRRIGKQNSGFSDEDVSDIICLLYPHSAAARQEANRIALENSSHILGRHDADNVNVDLSHEDDASRFQPSSAGDYAIILRLSAKVHNPAQGFTFGRNVNRCDIVFHNDPVRRLSNIHFRVYVNDYGVVMIEDTSTNGTIVDNQLLKCRSTKPTRRTLSSGSIIQILMHDESSDLSFLVRIPRRDGEYDAVYTQNLANYLRRQRPLDAADARTIVPDQGGRLNLFPEPPTQRKALPMARPAKPKASERLPKDWDGSGRYNVSGTIGKGAFATVHMATSKFDGCPYAAKELEKRRFMKNGVLDQKVENEMRIMQSVQHTNIVQYIEHFDWKDRLIIIMEYVPLGDLGHYIMDNGPLTEDMVQSMAVQMLGALEHLHEKNITHRDIKPDNILISSDQPFQVKLTDFGLSKMVDNEQTFLTTFCGTLLYCAPEVYGEFIEYDEHGNRDPNRRRQKSTAVGHRYEHAVDIWSLGGVLFYCLAGSAPYPVKTGITYMELLNIVMTTELDVSPLQNKQVSLEGIDCLQGMINRNPSLRATTRQLLMHKWLGGEGIFGYVEQSLSDDEISDDQLEQSASQLRIAEDRFPQNDGFDSQPVPSLSDLEEEKENNTFGPNTRMPRLFGEVGMSALRSSGAIPANHLNLPVGVSSSSMGETEIMRVIPDSESDDFSTPRQRSQPMIFSMSQGQDILDDIEPRPESQSLGCAESILGNLNMKSLIRNNSVLTSSDFTSSKRKPLDRSDEEEFERSQSGMMPIKRLKSEGQIDTLISDSPEEFILFASVPPAAAASRRQIEAPVHKSTFWNSSDRRTWHLRYPEMVNSQYMAFRSAALQRGEDFSPSKSPLWDLAMKYFPPTTDLTTQARDDSSDEKSAGRSEYPPHSTDPNSQSPDAFPIKVPATQAIASFESAGDSVIQDVSVSVATCFASFGREARNSVVYSNIRESRIPKNAFKIILWRPGFDAASQRRPWMNSPAPSENKSPESLAYAFYVSTKASNGIFINRTQLQSHESKKSGGESKHWIKLHDGDHILLWYRENNKTGENVGLTFRCTWGGSSVPRPLEPIVPVAEDTARSIDMACIHAERAYRRQMDYERAMEKADDEMIERRRYIQREIELKKAFEEKRLVAQRNLAARSRRLSPAPGAIPVPSRVVPQYRHTSPAMLRGVPAEEG